MMREFGGPLGESDHQTFKKLSRLETEIERAKGAVHSGEVIMSRKRDAKAEERGGGKEAGQKSSSSPLKELIQ
jgi:hypothetical protein